MLQQHVHIWRMLEKYHQCSKSLYDGLAQFMHKPPVYFSVWLLNILGSQCITQHVPIVHM